MQSPEACSFQAAIFDMDGTLADSMPWWENLAYEYLNLHGTDTISDEIKRKLDVITVPEAAELFQKEFDIRKPKEQMVRELDALMGEHYRNDVKFKPGMESVVKTLAEKNIPMCIASGTGEVLVGQCLEGLNIRDDFQFILSCQEMETSKEKPDIFLEAARRFDLPPEKIMVFEDALFSMKTAKDAGFQVTAIKDPTNASVWPEIEQLADAVISI